MRKLMAVVIHYLLRCATLLALPAVAAAQPALPEDWRVRTRDAGGRRSVGLAAIAWLLLSLLVPAEAFAVGEDIALNPVQGPPGQRVTLTGTGWTYDAQTGGAVVIWIDSLSAEVALAYPNANGNFSVSFRIPSSSPQGALKISALGSVSADAYFTVTGTQPTPGPRPTPPQTSGKLEIQRVWTEGAGGNNRTTFAPGNTIRFVAKLNNSHGGALREAELALATDFYNDSNKVTIPAGISTWTWDATAPSKQGDYTATVKAWDRLNKTWAMRSARFTVKRKPVAPKSPPQPPRAAPLLPGWYSNGGGSGSSVIYEDDHSGLRIVWGDSYLYRRPGESLTYWYTQVIYLNVRNTPLSISCAGLESWSVVRAHFRSTPTAPSGFAAAFDTFCSLNPNFTDSIPPGEAFYNWAIIPFFTDFNPPAQVSLEWGPYGSSEWVDPWHRRYPLDLPPPGECPPGGVPYCQPVSSPIMTAHLTEEPQGRAPNLIVLVHGCCTSPDHLRRDWDSLTDEIVRKIVAHRSPMRWEIVVLNWTDDTREPFWQGGFNSAYDKALFRGRKLKDDFLHAHERNPYKYVHLIGHSAGAKLIDVAAKEFVKIQTADKPFIHLTFLDAFTQTPEDSGEEDENNDGIILGYGHLPNYPEDKHYAEHYVAMDIPGTDALLEHAFNFDITDWEEDKVCGGPLERCHHWPRHWYIRSVVSPDTTGDLGFELSLEGGNGNYSTLANRFRPGQVCELTGTLTAAICGLTIKQSSLRQ